MRSEMRFGGWVRAVPVGLFLAWAGAATAAEVCIYLPDGVKTVRGAWVDDADPNYHDDICAGQAPYGGRYNDMLQTWGYAFLSVADGKGWTDSNDVKATLLKFAQDKGHPELANVPLVTNGMSHTNTTANFLHEKFPQRVISAANIHLTYEFAPTDTQVLKTPWFTMTSRRDWLWDGLTAGFSHRPQGAQFFPVKKSGEHAYADAELMLLPFHEQCMRYRVPGDWDPLAGPPQLRNFADGEGWLGFGDETYGGEFSRVVPAASYYGDRNNPFWVPGEYVAKSLRAFLSYSSDVTMASPAMAENRFALSTDYGTSVTVSATVKGAPSKVTLYDGDIPLQSFTAGPYTYASDRFAPGIHSFHALAEFADHNAVSHPAIHLIKDLPDIRVGIARPYPWERLVKGQAIQLQAAVRGAVTEVEYFLGDASLGKASAAPWAISWSPAAAGEYVITAVARAGSASRYSFPAKLTVYDQAPVPAKVVVKPRTALPLANEKVQFRAEVRDQYGFLLNPQPAIAWSASGGGAIDANGLLTAQAQAGGPFTITASAAGLKDTAAFQVTGTLRIKFGPAYSLLPDGFRRDDGSVFGPRADGLAYGWNAATRYSRSRWVDSTVPLEFQAWQTLRSINNPPYNKGWSIFKWEIQVPNGKYRVRIGAGDAAHLWDVGQGLSSDQWSTLQDSLKILAESVLVVDTVPDLSKSYVEATKEVEVKDGRLTISPYWTDVPGNSTASLDVSVRCRRDPVDFVELTPEGQTPPIISGLRPSPANRFAPALRWEGGRPWAEFGAGVAGEAAVLDLSGREVWRGRGQGRLALPPVALGSGARLVRLRAAGQGRVLKLAPLP